MNLEAVLLTGGRSQRMGTDKSKLLLGGEQLGSRLARLLATVAEQVTVLGREPVEGHLFIPDGREFEGPLLALSRFKPQGSHVFIAACDLPMFDPGIVKFLESKLVAHPSVHAVVPVVDHRPQPLCALYRAEAFEMMSTVCAENLTSVLSWVDDLLVEWVSEEDLAGSGIDPASTRSCDTVEKFNQLFLK